MNTEVKPYLIVIYGKDGCDLCSRLKFEVTELLEREGLGHEFGLDYQNLSTAEGMAAYALSETVNGQRIPALQIMKHDSETGAYVKIPDKRPEVINSETGEFFVPVYLQLQTEYGSGNPAIDESGIMELMTLAMAG